MIKPLFDRNKIEDETPQWATWGGVGQKAPQRGNHIVVDVVDCIVLLEITVYEQGL